MVLPSVMVRNTEYPTRDQYPVGESSLDLKMRLAALIRLNRTAASALLPMLVLAAAAWAASSPQDS